MTIGFGRSRICGLCLGAAFAVMMTSAMALADTRTINTAGGTSFSRGIIGQNVPALGTGRTEGVVATPKALEVSYNSSIRGVAGGLEADTYNWKDRTGRIVGAPGIPAEPTLEFLRRARDRNSILFITVNSRGTGNLIGWGTFYYTDETLPPLLTLADDWVRYTNFIVPTYRYGDTATGADAAILNSLQWSPYGKLLFPSEAATSKVIYWEIGNEPGNSSIGQEIPEHWTPALTAAQYLDRYKQIVAIMKARDSQVRVGCAGYYDTVFADPGAVVDFVIYHPYTDMWSAFPGYSGGGITQLQAYLRSLKSLQNAEAADVRSRLVAHGRSTSTPLVASEWNPCGSGADASLYRTQAHALGCAETIFAFAENNVFAAHYWIHPGDEVDGTECPDFKLFEAMQNYLGTSLVDNYTDGNNFRLYTTKNGPAGEVVLWGLNFSNSTNKDMTLSISNLGFTPQKITRMTLDSLTGTVTLTSSNEPGQPITVDWVKADMTGTNLANFTVTFKAATVTAIVISPTAPANALAVIPPSLRVDPAAGSTTLSVSNTGAGEMSWTAQILTGSDWLSIASGASGLNAGTVTLNYTQKTTAANRVGTIRVAASGASGSPRDITVTQTALDSEYIRFGADASIGVFRSATGAPIGSSIPLTGSNVNGFKMISGELSNSNGGPEYAAYGWTGWDGLVRIYDGNAGQASVGTPLGMLDFTGMDANQRANLRLTAAELSAAHPGKELIVWGDGRICGYALDKNDKYVPVTVSVDEGTPARADLGARMVVGDILGDSPGQEIALWGGDQYLRILKGSFDNDGSGLIFGDDLGTRLHMVPSSWIQNHTVKFAVADLDPTNAGDELISYGAEEYTRLYDPDTQSQIGRSVYAFPFNHAMDAGFKLYVGDFIKDSPGLEIAVMGFDDYIRVYNGWGLFLGPNSVDSYLLATVYDPSNVNSTYGWEVNDFALPTPPILITVTPPSSSLNSPAGQTTFVVTKATDIDVSWTASVIEGANWLSITSGASGVNTATITASYPANNTTGARTAKIRVTATGTGGLGTTVDVTVSQNRSFTGDLYMTYGAENYLRFYDANAAKNGDGSINQIGPSIFEDHAGRIISGNFVPGNPGLEYGTYGWSGWDGYTRFYDGNAGTAAAGTQLPSWNNNVGDPGRANVRFLVGDFSPSRPGTEIISWGGENYLRTFALNANGQYEQIWPSVNEPLFNLSTHNRKVVVGDLLSDADHPGLEMVTWGDGDPYVRIFQANMDNPNIPFGTYLGFIHNGMDASINCNYVAADFDPNHPGDELLSYGHDANTWLRLYDPNTGIQIGASKDFSTLTPDDPNFKVYAGDFLSDSPGIEFATMGTYDNYIRIYKGSDFLVGGAMNQIKSIYEPLSQNPDYRWEVNKFIPSAISLSGDVNGDGVVNAADLTIVLAAMDSKPPSDTRADLDSDGEVTSTDLAMVLANMQ